VLKIIISPAKKMNVTDDFPVEVTLPHFLEQTEEIKAYLHNLDYGTLKGIWKCNDQIAEQNVERLKNMELRRRLTPAVIAYEGLQYQSMAPGVMERSALDYLGRHLYILSGFYGILRAFDGVTPYRLEMQARIEWMREKKIVTNLYDYWGSSIYQVLDDQEEPLTIVNLASKEYSKAIEPWLTSGVRFLTCVFGEVEEESPFRVRVKATAAKMARGAMVRFMAQNRVTDAEQIKGFHEMGYSYMESLSDDTMFVFGTKKQ